MADNNYAIVNTNENTVRFGDPGEATVLGTKDDGKSTSIGSGSWKPWAFTAGGGALAYVLAKYLMGDDDERDEKGRKKEKGWFKTLLPYMAAAGGALAGHSLSTPQPGSKGGKGEFAVKLNDDGTFNEVNKPSGGTAANVGAAGAAATSLAAGARARANYGWHAVNRAKAQARDLENNAVFEEMMGNRVEAARLRANANKLRMEAADILTRQNGRGFWDRIKRFFSQDYGKGSRSRFKRMGGKVLGTKGSAGVAALSSLSAAYLGALGYGINKDLQKVERVMEVLNNGK